MCFHNVWPTHFDWPNTHTCMHIQIHCQLGWVCFTHLFVCVFMFVLHSPPQLSNSCSYAVGIITASPANNDNGAGDYHGTRKERWVGERGVGISLNDKRLHNLASFSSPSLYHPSIHTFLHPIPPFLRFFPSSHIIYLLSPHPVTSPLLHLLLSFWLI